MDEIYKYCGDIPFILLGLKKDTFTGSNMRAPFHPDLNIPVSSTKVRTTLPTPPFLHTESPYLTGNILIENT